MNENYRILLRPREGQSPELESASVRDHLVSVPGISSRGERLLLFGEEDEHGVMTIRLSPESSADTMQTIEVSIPGLWVKQRGPQVFAIVFMMQGWTGWEVYDPQIESTLERETVLQGMVAMRQAQREREGSRVPKPRLGDD